MKIRGGFRTFVRSMELSDEELGKAFGLDPDYMDVEKELDEIKLNLTGKEPNQHIH